MTAHQAEKPVELTDGQVEVLTHMACGLGQPEISRVMQISVHSVRSHLAGALTRFGTNSGTHAVALAIGHGLLPADVATSATRR